ncbi:MAG TPA: HDIG domain-containing protein [Candidatus Limnocylindrales bacterium]|nr:HDIG domain-containing protein [Candidatus Limnocylindrales bacterium]
MADVPLPRPELTNEHSEAAELIAGAIPPAVRDILTRLTGAGHAAFAVGGSLRDILLDRPAADWDLASSALPERVVTLFPGAVYENAFGTVAVREHGDVFEVTTFRTDHVYADFRRPHRVEFSSSIEADLARRDFTINAMAWGWSPGDQPALLDPAGGVADCDRRIIRTVGEPDARFAEDALRMVRAVRLAAELDFTVEPATLEAIGRNAGLAAHLSAERVAAELDRMLAAPRPSIGLRLMEATGLLGVLVPELAAQRGVAQDKIPGDDLWDHTCRAVDAGPPDRPIVRLAALLHDIGKPATAADGRFHGHESVGAEMADVAMRRLRIPRTTAQRVASLIAEHMWNYEPAWSDAAVRRFIRKIGIGAIDELFALRAADSVGSGLDPDAGGLAEVRRRVEAQLAAAVALDRGDLAIDGDDLISELGLEPGPRLGRYLDELTERVVADPGLNERPTLLLLAQGMLADDVL